MTITIWLFSHLKGSDYITRLDSVQDRSGVTMCMMSSIYELIETRMRLCYSGKLVSFSTTDGILLSTFTNHFCTQRLLQVWLWLLSVHRSFLGSLGISVYLLQGLVKLASRVQVDSRLHLLQLSSLSSSRFQDLANQEARYMADRAVKK